MSQLEPLDPALYRELVRRAIAEDLGWGDVTTDATVTPAIRGRGILMAKSRCVLAGLEVALETFRQLDPALRVSGQRQDGEICEPGDRIAELAGSAAPLLTAERTALNFLQRLSGIATLTRAFVDAAGGRIVVLDTRKTTPTLRVLEKYAVRVGGGVNHRLSLDSGILIKDNHIRLAGSLREAVTRMRATDPELPIEVEVQDFSQLEEALQAGVARVLADNFSLEEMGEVVRRTRGRAKVEISGGVTLERMPAIAATGAEYVSVGALTHSARAADISFEIERAD